MSRTLLFILRARGAFGELLALDQTCISGRSLSLRGHEQIVSGSGQEECGSYLRPSCYCPGVKGGDGSNLDQSGGCGDGEK